MPQGVQRNISIMLVRRQSKSAYFLVPLLLPKLKISQLPRLDLSDNKQKIYTLQVVELLVQ